jgi:nucleoside-triphosphatase
MKPGGNNLLLAGPPGCGKTTIIESVVRSLGRDHVAGFLTREIRESGSRQGFLIEATDGSSATLAHVDRDVGPRVGRYRVDVPALESIVERSLSPPQTDRLTIIDEIGKMECLSPVFRNAVVALIESHGIVIATIATRAGGFIARVRSLPRVETMVVTAGNRDAIPARVLDWVNERRRNT